MTNAVGSSVKIQQFGQTVRIALKEGFPGCIVGAVMANKIAVLVPYEKGELDYNERIQLIDRSRELVRSLRRQTDCSFRIGIGSVQPLQDLVNSYQEALEALVKSTGSVAHADDLPIGCEYEESYPVDMEKQLFAAVENGELNRALATAEDFFQWMMDNHADNPMDIRLKVLEFVLYAERIAYENGGMTYAFNTRKDYLPAVMGTENMSDVEKWFIGKINDACQNVLRKSSEKSTSLVELAKEYINNNYSKDISLDDVSRQVNISPYYFSKIFKEDMGEGFVEYLTKIRMEKAKELLTTTEYSMKEICAMVGYADPNYFSRSFKKNVGVTPTEYKEGSSK